jgi:predicted ribosome quality control (RQC) complex YloA/Tae2 family protein
MSGELPSQDQLLKKNISNVDLAVLAYELNSVLQEGFILNIYEVPETELLIFKCRTKDGKRNILIDPKKRINLTNFEYPTPSTPSQFITSVRKFIKGRRIDQIAQYNMDRILYIQLRTAEGAPWKFVVEFFDGGNYIILDGDNRIIMAKHYVKSDRRELLPKKIYEFPPSRGIDLNNLTKDTFLSTIKAGKGDLVRFMARNFNMGGYIAEEICLNAQIDKTIEVTSISDQNLDRIFAKIEDFMTNLRDHRLSPRLIFNSHNQAIGFEPFAYNLYNNYLFELKSTFNETIDEFFAKFDTDLLLNKESKVVQAQLSKTEKIVKAQKAKIEESLEIREESLEKAHIIYQYLQPIDNLINMIMSQKRDNKREWAEITEAIMKGKEKNIPECVIFEKIYPKEVSMEINLEGTRFKVNLLKSAIDNATELYDKAKKAKRKAFGAEKALQETQAKLDQEKAQNEDILNYKPKLLRKPPQKWYEKFRWFISSDDFIVVGGRDASTNELLVKKHMRGQDLFFHTTTRGAPVCIVQNPNNLPVPETTLRETANFDASYSAAWKNGWGNADIYYVYPDQVSKSPKSGEYLPKGSFYVTGKKNMLPKPYLELAIGVELVSVSSPTQDSIEQPLNNGTDEICEESDQEMVDANENDASDDIPTDDLDDITEELPTQDSSCPRSDSSDDHTYESGEVELFYPKIISGPVSAIKRRIQNYVILKPTKNHISTSDLAKKILKRLIQQAKENEQGWVKLISINDLIRVIPSGDSEIISK